MFKVSCYGCGEKFPQTMLPTSPPPAGKVTGLAVPGFKAYTVCLSCWNEALALGYDLNEKSGRKAWTSTDWKKVKVDRAEEIAQGIEQSRLDTEKMNSIIVTTGDIKQPYEIVDLVFNIGADSEVLGGLFGILNADPQKAFKTAVLALKKEAHQLGCDGVIHTHFEHRVTATASAAATVLQGVGVSSVNQGIEVFAYGTAVKFL